MYSYSFKPLIDKPTRVSHTTSTLIDNIFTNDLQHKHDSSILITDVSDHYPIITFRNDSVTITRPKIKFRPYSDQNKLNFSSRLENEQWGDIYNLTNAQVAYDLFSSTVIKHYTACFPLIERYENKRDSKQWITNGLKISIKHKNKLYTKFKRIPSVTNEITYKRYKYKLRNLIEAAKKLHFKQLIETNRTNIKNLWANIKEVIGTCNKRKTLIEKLEFNNNEYNNSRDIADSLNDYFANVGPDLDCRIPTVDSSPLQYLNGSYTNSLFLTEISTNEVLTCLLNLKDSASGHDELKPKIIKHASQHLVSPLTHILQLCFETSTVPQQLKTAHITPIFKGGDSHLPQNYRPISILPVFSKIFERLLYNRLYAYFTSNKIISDKQFGFRKGFSTEMALTYALSEITSKIDQGKFVIGLFIDLKKAFDTVNHSILLKKLNHYGVRGEPLLLIQNYLSDRMQSVKLDGCCSEPVISSCGVPQGSILGPLFFLIYINDLENALSNSVPVMYADDTNIFLSGNNIDSTVEEFNLELNNLNIWFKANRLSLNTTKTHLMLFSTNRHVLNTAQINVKIDNQNINRCSTNKFLGVKINERLDWKDHINYITDKISKSSGVINKLSKVFDEEVLTMLYYSLVYPYLTYCNLIWGNAYSTHISRLITLQKRIIRILSFSDRIAHTQPIFRRLKIIKVKDLYTYFSSIFLYKLKYNMFPGDFSIKFFRLIEPRHSVYGGITRSVSLQEAHVPWCRTSLRQRTIECTGPRLYNSFLLPRRLTECQSLSVLKRTIKLSLTQDQ